MTSIAFTLKRGLWIQMSDRPEFHELVSHAKAVRATMDREEWAELCIEISNWLHDEHEKVIQELGLEVTVVIVDLEETDN